MKLTEAEKIWEHWLSHHLMTIQPKRNEQLKPAKRVVNFLGSVESYKEKFLKATESYQTGKWK